jgi:ribosome recycling factor
MQEVVEILQTDIGSIRTGRATPGLVEDLEVSVYGGQQELKINELATINVIDPQTIVIDPFDKSIIGDIRKGIMSANVGLNPSIDGEIIRISLPPMTTEDRDKYTKLLSTKLENAKIMIRQIRQDYMKQIKDSFEEGMLTEDEKFQREKKLQDITDEYNEKIESVGKQKENELKQI